jgi:hypothetical protein
MLVWLVAVAIGIAAAAFQYGRPSGGDWFPALLRVLSVAVLVALCFDAPLGRGQRLRPFAALDVSASWRRAGDSAAYQSAISAITHSGADSVFLVGDSLRAGPPPAIPTDIHSAVRPAVERALAAGRPLVLVTDGEVDDPEALVDLPAGSKVVVIPRADRRDGAIALLDAPRAAVAGDTIELWATLAAGAAGSPAGAVAFSIADRTAAATVPVDALPPHSERVVSARVAVPKGDGPRAVRAVWSATGDADARNDTLTEAIDVSPAAGAVFVSTSPDEDARFALSVLRGALALPTVGYYRVSPGQWRTEGTLTSVSDADIRRAIAIAPLVVFDGDTAVFGPPRAVTHGGLALIVPPAPAPDEEWYATGAPPSPIAQSLAGVVWDSLPPIDVPAVTRTGEWTGLEAKRARRFDRRVAVSGGTVGGRRVVIVTASGLWRWRFRPGTDGDAFTALWGGIFDWLAAERRDLRPAVPADALVREGDPIRWRRGSSSDSMVSVVLRPHGRPTAPPDSLVVDFTAGGATAETPPLPPGLYDVRTVNGAALLAVNASREWLPRTPIPSASAAGGVAIAASALRLRSISWLYIALVVSLCAEWLWRRRVGLR